jgi:putative transposase
MGARGCAYDNAVCEAFFKTLKSELVDRRSWSTKAEARHAVSDFIETFFNRRRRHSTLGYLSRAEYEEIATST